MTVVAKFICLSSSIRSHGLHLEVDGGVDSIMLGAEDKGILNLEAVLVGGPVHGLIEVRFEGPWEPEGLDLRKKRALTVRCRGGPMSDVLSWSRERWQTPGP